MDASRLEAAGGGGEVVRAARFIPDGIRCASE